MYTCLCTVATVGVIAVVLYSPTNGSVSLYISGVCSTQYLALKVVAIYYLVQYIKEDQVSIQLSPSLALDPIIPELLLT